MKQLAIVGWIGICLGVIGTLLQLYMWRVGLDFMALRWLLPTAAFAFLGYVALFSRQRTLIVAAGVTACLTTALDLGLYLWGPNSPVASGYVSLVSRQVILLAAWALPFIVFSLRIALRGSLVLSRLDLALAWFLVLAVLAPLVSYASDIWDVQVWRQNAEALERPMGLYAVQSVLGVVGRLGAAVFLGALAWAQTKRKPAAA